MAAGAGEVSVDEDGRRAAAFFAHETLRLGFTRPIRARKRFSRRQEAVMDFGVVTFPTDCAIQTDELARALEDSVCPRSLGPPSFLASTRTRP